MRFPRKGMSTDTGRGGESGASKQVEEERAEVRGVAASDISGVRQAPD
jgi:hypothetical protein